jgi:photosystem II stability/assembly factor-like uncharacterized protein
MRTILPAVVVCGTLLAAVIPTRSQTWAPTSASTSISWWSIASSADGSKLVAGSSASRRIYTSTNSGGTWISNNVPFTEWSAVASSADGSTLIAVSSLGPVVLSTNSGTLWTTSNVPASNWSSVASSADGTVLAFVQSQDDPAIFVSTNAGASWRSNTVIGMPAATVACSADGSKLFLLTDGSFYSSTNAGTTWAHITHVGALNGNSPIASSVDGTRLAVAFNNDGIYTSTNSGANWTKNNVSFLPWRSIASSADGKELVAVVSSGGIYSSTNAGTTWQNDGVSSESWTSVASSADGSTRVAASSNAGIYQSRLTPTPELNIASLPSGLALSWIVPSTNLVLQQNVDLTTANWTTVPNAPTLDLSHLEYGVVLPPTNAAAFFRLTSGP